MNRSEHTANVGLAMAPVNAGWKAGKNFAQPLPNRAKMQKTNFLARLRNLSNELKK